MKRTIGSDYFQYYSELIDEAKKKEKLDDVHAEFARSDFSDRNKVVHDSSDPRAETAEDVLYRARTVLSVLYRVEGGI